VTEIYDHLRLLFARIGHPHCPNGHEIERQTIQQIVDQVLALPEGTRLLVLGPLIKDRKTEGDRIFEAARRQGFVRVRVDGELMDLAETKQLDKYKRHSIEVVVDRYIVRRADAADDAPRDAATGRPIDAATGESIPDPDAARLADSIETALRLGDGVVVIAPVPSDDGSAPVEERRYSERFTRPYDGFTMEELEPRSFSFNSPHGACPACTGPGPGSRSIPASSSPTGRRAFAAAPSPVRGADGGVWRAKIVEAICAAHGWTSTPRWRTSSRGPRLLSTRRRTSASSSATTSARNTHRDLRGARQQPRASLPRTDSGTKTELEKFW
jgi:excinuclease ABC subunit A